MHRSYLFLTLCVFGALAYRIDYDLKELQGWQYADSDECTKDIVIVLDTSKSVGNSSFEYVKKFLQNLVTNEALNVKKDGTRVGFVIFSSEKKTEKLLDIGQIDDAAGLKQYMGNLTWKNVEGGHTRTDMGLKEATKMFVEYKENEPGRNKFGDVAIVVTDGKPRGITNDDRGIALNATRALKDEGVLVIGAGVGNDFKSNSPKSSEEVAKLKQFIKDMATSPENVIFEESFHDINSIIGKLVNDSCFTNVKCTCPEEKKTKPFYTKPGESTVTLPKSFRPDFECYDGKKPYDATIKGKKVTPKLPSKFSVGEETYSFEFTLDKGGPLTCPLTVVVRKGKQCRGVAYDSVAKVCCCGTIHDKKPAHRCCGPEYYNSRKQKCCEGANLISASEKCLE